jgi:hypothetical protein
VGAITGASRPSDRVSLACFCLSGIRISLVKLGGPYFREKNFDPAPTAKVNCSPSLGPVVCPRTSWPAYILES